MSGGMVLVDVSGKAEVVLTTKGDLATWDTARVRKGVSATNYTGLQADSAIADGLTYGATARSTLTGTSDILYSSAANTLSRLAVGSARQVLQTNSATSAPEWTNSPQSLMDDTGQILYSSAANTLAKLDAATNGDTLQLSAGVPAWVTVSAGGGAWAEIANQDDGDDFTIGGTGSSLFDDYKYIHVIGDFKQTGNNYVEFDFIDTAGIVTGNQQLYMWYEQTVPSGNGYARSTDRNRCGYIENGNTIFVDFLFQTQATGTHQCVNWKTNSSGNNDIACFNGIFWINTSNRLKGIEYSGLGTITASTCSYKVIGLT